MPGSHQVSGYPTYRELGRRVLIPKVILFDFVAGHRARHGGSFCLTRASVDFRTQQAIGSENGSRLFLALG